MVRPFEMHEELLPFSSMVLQAALNPGLPRLLNRPSSHFSDSSPECARSYRDDDYITQKVDKPIYKI